MSEIWGDWIEWKGGKMPVPGNEKVMAGFRVGETSRTEARALSWAHMHDDWDITAYRRLRENEVREAAAKSPALNTDRAQLMSLADEASSIVSGDRRADYGKPERNFERIAHLWTGYAKAKGWEVEITAADVSPLMMLLKMARIVENPGHRDSYVDAIGYAITAAEVNGVK